MTQIYDEIENYLDGLAQEIPSPRLTFLDDLATRYFRTTDPLHNIYLKKTLIAAVARIKLPGCKHPVATILMGGQGIGKTAFWRVLFGDTWFTDELGADSVREEFMKLHSYWCLEFEDFDSSYQSTKVNPSPNIFRIKNLISSSSDIFRKPFSKDRTEHPRRSILVASSNSSELFKKGTGNRRLWVIPVTGHVPVELLDEERDLIWATALALYQANEDWWLTEEESLMHEGKVTA